MFHAEEMVKVRISGPKNLMKEIIGSLYDLNLLHVNPFKKKENDFFNSGNSFDEASEYSKTLVELRSVIDLLKIRKSKKIKKIENISQANARFVKIFEEVKFLNSELTGLRKEREAIKRKLEEPVLNLNVKPFLLKGYSNVKLFKGVCQSDFEPELKNEVKSYYLMGNNEETANAFILVVPLSEEEKTRKILLSHGFAESEIKFDESKKELESMLASVRKKIRLKRKELRAIKKKHKLFINSFEQALTQLNEKAEAPLQFASSMRSFFVNGWIPAESLQKFENSLSLAAKKRIHIEKFDAGEKAPTKLENPKPTNAFELFLDLYSLPKYYELDPTVLFSITFPLFFGFMLGDVGYGLLVFLISYTGLRLLKPGKQLKNLLTILLLSSISTIFFGFVFAEFFGVEFVHNPLINRVHGITQMLLISVLVGVLHINLGFVLKAVNGFAKHGLMGAIEEGISWILLELGVALVILENFGMISFGLISGGIISLIALVLMVKGEGFAGIIEIPSAVGHIISYARLFGIGLSSVQLALIINNLAGQHIWNGITGFIIGLIVILLGHAINLWLGVMGSFIQSMRLHYVEFFTKFYKGNGIRYMPFGWKRGD